MVLPSEVIFYKGTNSAQRFLETNRIQILARYSYHFSLPLKLPPFPLFAPFLLSFLPFFPIQRFKRSLSSTHVIGLQHSSQVSGGSEGWLMFLYSSLGSAAAVSLMSHFTILSVLFCYSLGVPNVTRFLFLNFPTFPPH